MKTPFPDDPAPLNVAHRVIWFEPPERALADPVRFLIHVMTYRTIEDIAVVRRYVELDDFREASGTRRPVSWTSVPGRIGMP